MAWPASAGAGGDPPPPTTGAQADARIELASIDQSSVTPGGTVTLALAVDVDPAAEAEINVVAHRVVDSRIRFERTLVGEDLGSVADVIALPLAALPRSAGVVLLPVGLQDPAAPGDPSRLRLSETGVYPLEVELNDADGETLSEFVLPLVVTAPNPDGTPIVGERLRVAWVWPLSAAPAVEPFGRPDPAVVEQLNPNGRIGRQAAALAAAPDIPFTVAPGPETLDAWTLFAANDAALADSLTSMQEALDTNQVLAGPYVPLNVPSLVTNGFRDQVGAELARGTEALSARRDEGVDPGTALTSPINNDALTYLRAAGVARMIVNGEALVPIDSQFTPAQPFLLQSPSATTTAVATDPGLNAMLTSDAPPALRSQQLLAGLSVVALEQPNATRGIVIANPPDWDAPEQLLDAAIGGLRGNELLQPVDIDQFVAQVPPALTDDDVPVVRQLQPYVPPPPPVTPAAYGRAEAELNALRSLIGPADPRILAGERALLTALSSAWDRQRARAELGVIGAASSEVLSQIHVPVGSTVTLTARKGEIPVTFLNETDRTLRVKVSLESDKLFFPEGAEREIELPPRNTTVGFTVESRASGTFPLELTVTSVDEVLVIQSTRVRVRSTFVSGVGVFITVGAALFLAGWWLLHFRRRRRPRASAAA
ncbi:MAG: DUF6049 family protein [Acidimicrobiia bacterium]